MMQLEGFQASHACDIARVSRASFYRHYEEHEPHQDSDWTGDGRDVSIYRSAQEAWRRFVPALPVPALPP
ncbi:MAG: hypothetical protein ABSF25_25655 [Bryobacteraceae bacterium]|jgi:hypothetical protein